MALNDIEFTAGSAQRFILEIPQGTLGTPNDISYPGTLESELVLQAGAGVETMEVF